MSTFSSNRVEFGMRADPAAVRSDGGADCLKVLEASGKLPQGFERNPPPAGRQGQRASSSGTDDDDGLGMAAYGAAG